MSGTPPGAPSGGTGGMASSGGGQQALSGMQPPGILRAHGRTCPGQRRDEQWRKTRASSGSSGRALPGDISWLLAFALIGVLAWIRRPATLTLKGIKEAGSPARGD